MIGLDTPLESERTSVLDFDLDYFFYPPIHYAPWAGWFLRDRDRKRLQWDRQLHYWMSRDRLKTRLRELEVPPIAHRRAIEHHQEALPFWLELVHAGVLSVPFTVYHFDAHSDLYLSRQERDDRHFQRMERLANQGQEITSLLNEANFLWWAIYLGLTDRIVWIVPEPQFRGEYEIHLEPRYIPEPLDSEAAKAFRRQARQTRFRAYKAYAAGRPAEGRAAWAEADRLQIEAVAARHSVPRVCRRFGMEVAITVTTLERLDRIEGARAVNLCRSPDYTPAKADRFLERFFSLFAAVT